MRRQAHGESSRAPRGKKRLTAGKGSTCKRRCWKEVSEWEKGHPERLRFSSPSPAPCPPPPADPPHCRLSAGLRSALESGGPRELKALGVGSPGDPLAVWKGPETPELNGSQTPLGKLMVLPCVVKWILFPPCCGFSWCWFGCWLVLATPCVIFFPQPGTNPSPRQWKQSPHQWNTREYPLLFFTLATLEDLTPKLFCRW